MTKNDKLSKVLFIGIVLLLIGMLLIHAAPFVTNYGSNTPDDPGDVQDDEAFQNSLKYGGHILFDLGVFAIVMEMFLVPFYREDLDLKFRLAALGIGFLVLLFTWFTVY